MSNTVVLELKQDILSEAEALGVDIAAAVDIGLRDAIRQARILRDLSDEERQSKKAADP